MFRLLSLNLTGLPCAFQQEYVAAQNRGQQTSKGLERTKKQLEEARGRFDRAYRKFLEDNPDYARSTAQRTQLAPPWLWWMGALFFLLSLPPPPALAERKDLRRLVLGQQFHSTP